MVPSLRDQLCAAGNLPSEERVDSAPSPASVPAVEHREFQADQRLDERNPRRPSGSHPPAQGYRRTSFDLAAALKNALALVAAHEDRPMVAIVEEALVLWMRQHGYIFEDEAGPILADRLAPARPGQRSAVASGM